MSIAWPNMKQAGTSSGAFWARGIKAGMAFFVALLTSLFFLVSGASAQIVPTTGGNTTEGIYPPPTGIFDPSVNDAAQQWIDFLFDNGDLRVFLTSDSAVGPSWFVPNALQAALAFYSLAILIIAAVILIYHIVSLTLKTAHLGGAMGKMSTQIWAPLRLVMAIGLLVPIDGGLSSGQYIVIKTASLGSGLASRAWDLFLINMVSNHEIPVPAAPMATEIASKLLLNYACVVDYNARLDRKLESIGTAPWHLTLSKIKLDPETSLPASSRATINGRVGTKYSFSSTNGIGGQDTCGAIFFPDIPDRLSEYDFAPQIYEAEAFAVKVLANLIYAQDPAPAWEILKLVKFSEAVGGTADVETLTTEAKGGPLLTGYAAHTIAQFQKDLKVYIENVFTSQEIPDMTPVVDEISQYGWAFAGAFLSTLERIQSMMSQAVQAGMPSVLPSKELTGQGFELGGINIGQTVADTKNWFEGKGDATDAVSETRKQVTMDLESYAGLVRHGWTPGTTYNANPTSEAQCASMLGLSSTPDAEEYAGILGAVNGIMDHMVIDSVLVMVDWVATWSGVWTATETTTCGQKSASPNMQTFQLGLDFTKSTEPLQELIKFGHANITTGLRLVGYGSMLLVGKGIAGAAATFGQGVAGMVLNALGDLAQFAGVFLIFFATVFLIMGFTFAFVLPLIPFTRFFFAVLIWIGEVVESVIAIPVVALAHLNPEGEGFIAEQAKTAYYFCFSIFLRPIMTLFGLITGLLIFTMAAYFLTYAYGFAVASSGGTAYGHEILSKIVYTLLYAFMMFVCANKSFEMITHLPEGAVKWMKGPKSRTPNLGHITDMQQYEQIVSGLAIDRATGGISKGAGDLGSRISTIGGKGSGGGGSAGPGGGTP